MLIILPVVDEAVFVFGLQLPAIDKVRIEIQRESSIEFGTADTSRIQYHNPRPPVTHTARTLIESTRRRYILEVAVNELVASLFIFRTSFAET